MPDFDAIIIGTRQAGPSLAFRLAGAGMKVAVVERHLVGGACVNTISGAVGYRPEPLERPADGNALICCCRPQGDIVIDL